MRGKKHCVICKKRFRPDPRIGDRPKCCGDPACRRARHVATKAAAYQRDKYDIAGERLARLLVGDGPSAQSANADLVDVTAIPLGGSSSASTIASDHVISASYAKVSWAVVSSAMGRKSAVVLKTLAKVASSAVSSEIDAKLCSTSKSYAKVGQRRVSTQIARARPSA